jgi:DNA polymerase-3 subunit delta'
VINNLLAAPQEILPWQTLPWQQLWQAQCQARLPHAVLLIGADGIGKSQFAYAVANTVLCHQPAENGAWCGQCHDCHMVRAKSHPDLMLIIPEEGKKISVDQIRHLVKNVYETTLRGGYRVIIIHPATAMNANAANALLKTLEEPPANTLFILISNQSLRLPATIISRCQKIFFSKPEYATALTWLNQKIADPKIEPHLLLKLADGAPFKALSFIESDWLNLRKEVYENFYLLSQREVDPLQLALKWQDADHLSLVDLLISWLTDLLRFQLSNHHTALVNADYKTEIVNTSVVVLQKNLLSYMDHLQQVRADLLSAVNLNKQLLLEDLFIRWAYHVSC